MDKPIKLSGGISYFRKSAIKKYGKKMLKRITGADEIIEIESLKGEDKQDEKGS
jgi:hypothetical protein